jgi:hypothetical protein
MANKSKNRKKSNTKASNKKKVQVKKVRGTALTIALVIVAIHGIIAAVLYYSLSVAPEVERPWILGLMVVHFLANVVAAAGIFYWKKWGLYVYAYSAIIALVVGLISIGAWSTFYMVLPVAILGWLLRSKWDYFD